jgi:alpha-tubulin suppressor-like RCC1 family protein
MYISCAKIFSLLCKFMTTAIYSGQTTAVITPRQVTVGLGRKRVNVVAAAKHHTVIATEAGELFTWGSNRGT